MSDQQKIAVVTGANRGIGLEIARQLAKKNDIQVIVTSRDEQKGHEACEQLHAQGLKVLYHCLDVASQESIHRFCDNLDELYGRCDILVNNAGIFPDTTDAGGGFPSVFDSELDTIERAMTTNVYGPFLLCREIVPLMKENNYGRIVNMSSGMGQLTHMNGGCPGYRISKTSLNALTRIMADELKGTNILVNSMCPGWVKTKMGGPNATRELPQGADTAVWLATLEDGGPSGLFFRDRKEFAW